MKYEDCCKPFTEVFKYKEINPEDLLLVDWFMNISPAHQESFYTLTHKYFYRISLYFENILAIFTEISFEFKDSVLNETITNIRLNINHSILSSTSLMTQGLFLQSGVLHRTAFEDLFVILDFVENPEQFNKFLSNKYTVNKILSRINDYIPKTMIEWYGYFTSNFTHFGQIHTAPYFPRKCHPDNFITVMGFQNLVRLLVSYHIILERIFFKELDKKYFWNQNANGVLQMDIDVSPISDWVSILGKEILKDFPLNEKKEFLEYSDKTYTFK
jgi:hypothetical protein